MGSFPGHILPGSLFIVFAVWWTILITRRWIVCSKTSTPFVNTATYHCWCIARRVSAEGLFKIVVTSVGIVGELLAGTKPIRDNQVGMVGDYNGFYVGDIQHVSMYTFFLLNGIVDCILHARCCKLPFSLDYVTSALAFAAEFILFYFHASVQEGLEKTLHTLLLWSIVACVASVLLEMNFRQSLLCGYFRAFTVFLQGTWFYQVAFILFPIFPSQQRWEFNASNTMYASIYFSWHLLLVVLLIVCIIAVTSVITSRCFGFRVDSIEVLKIRELSQVEGATVGRYSPINQESGSEDETTVFDSRT